MREFLGCFYFHFSLVFHDFEGFLMKQLFHSRLLDEIIMAHSALRTSLAIYHVISNARSWNNCEVYFDHCLSSLIIVCSPKKRIFFT